MNNLTVWNLGVFRARCVFHSGSAHEMGSHPPPEPPTGATPTTHCSSGVELVGGLRERCDSSQTDYTHTHTCTRICDGVHSWLWTGTNLNAVFRGHLVKSNTACRVCLCVGSTTHKIMSPPAHPAGQGQQAFMLSFLGLSQDHDDRE